VLWCGVLCCAVTSTDLALYPSEKWKDKGWDFIDSMDPTREWGGFSYMDMPNPAKGQEVGCVVGHRCLYVKCSCLRTHMEPASIFGCIIWSYTWKQSWETGSRTAAI
jgi:hypothetical protein